MSSKAGDVVLVNFPFTDLASSKLRPALVIAEHGTDVIILGIFSKVPETVEEGWLLVDSSSADFPSSGLKKTSVIKTNKIAVIHQSLIRKSLGRLPKGAFEVVKAKLRNALGL